MLGSVWSRSSRPQKFLAQASTTLADCAPLEEPGDRPGAAQVAVELVEGVPHVRRGAIAIVRADFDEQRHAVRPIDLVG